MATTNDMTGGVEATCGILMLPQIVRVTLCLACVVLLGAVGSAGAQVEVVDTHLRLAQNPFLAEGNVWNGDRVFAYLDVALCYQAGGVNPEEGEVVVRLERRSEPPAWVEVGLRDDELSIVPPTGVTLSSGCTPPVEFEIVMTAPGLVQWDSAFDLEFEVQVEGMGQRGTYAMPEAGNRTTFSVSVGPDPSEDPLGFLDDPAQPTVDAAEARGSPAPALLAPLAFLLALAAARDTPRGERRPGA